MSMYALKEIGWNMVYLIKYNVHNLEGLCTTDTYVKSDGSCACGFYLEQNLTWIEADDRCFSLGAHLPEVKSPHENEDIYKLKVNK